jgi:hypothetical protein
MMSNLDQNELIAEWLEAKTEKRRAELEAKIVVHVTGRDRTVDLAHLLGVSQYVLQCRVRLLGVGNDADPLWDLIDRGVILHGTAVTALRHAESMGGSRSAAVMKVAAAVLKAYDDTRYTRSIHGKKYVVRLPPIVDIATRPFNQQLRTMCMEYVDSRLGELPEIDRQSVRDEFLYGLRMLLDEVDNNIRRRQRAKKTSSEVKDIVAQNQIRDACDVLGVTYGPVIDMKAANKRFRKLAAQFHPDRVGDNPDMVKQYQALTEAWEILREFE